MTVTGAERVYYDPYDFALNADPYAVFRRLRDEAPLYYNDRHDFFALSRHDDVSAALVDHRTFSSARTAIAELIKANIEVPPGVLIFEDPPLHDVHRKLLSRMFTPRKVQALEPRIREFCAESLDPLVGTGRFDFVKDLGAQMPMKTISMLLGIPEADREAVRDHSNAQMRTRDGRPLDASFDGLSQGADMFSEYIEWRAKNPSDDIMTDLLNAEFEDETGTVRRLTRAELLNYVNVVAGAGNETTVRLIGWAGKILADHPGQRRELAENPELIPQAIEELLRFETPAPNVARYVTRDVEIHGHTVPEGSVMLLLLASATRDSRQHPPDGDVFDIHREQHPHIVFGGGAHYCLGSALARLEGRIALQEILNRFPEWQVDTGNSRFSSTSTGRGWDSLPTIT
ncbi:cytochrome P450 [Mycobacterium sp. CVI_P3]|uniref:Cytochrome P450 n=1 Tax=Mycobacterium pinniadriaticum TaxID=2994102 RepID=A0ABT3S8J0_9MYCO|nr:cytochrome P450 [Mycobacterium pinniadriaticum]MCX2929383.1 cytochrome P450 [Mycobacterium pinniadriaticum]MCX2935807.1 cytochrome P450 [Mycobacterium pinniadriaticum]